MKERKLYQCEICHTEYNEKKKAINCEKCHIQNLEVVNGKYRANELYPDWIEIKCSNGKVIRYKR